MRRVVAVVAGVVLASSISACTPRPNDAEPAASAFLEALERRDVESSAIDNPTSAADSTNATWDGLQAEDVTATLKDVRQEENLATATYELAWQLPRDRELKYDAQMTLTPVSYTHLTLPTNREV